MILHSALFVFFILPGPVVDLSARGMQKLDQSFTCSEDTHMLILDRNNIMKLDHLERCTSLQQVVYPSPHTSRQGILAFYLFIYLFVLCLI